MSTDINLAAVPTRGMLSERIRQMKRGLVAYQPGRKWFSFEFGGVQYHIPPDLGGKLVEHPVERDPATKRPRMVVANGELEIHDRYGILYDRPGEVPGGKMVPKGTGLLKGESSDAIIIYLVENYSERGCVWLEGDGNDEARKEAARKKIHRFLRGWAEDQRAARMEFVSNFKKLNPGRDVPPPKGTELEAQEYLDNLSQEARSAAAFVCDFNDYETSNWDAFERHLWAAHQQKREPPQSVIDARREAGQVIPPRVRAATILDSVARSTVSAPTLEEATALSSVQAGAGAVDESLAEQLAELEAEIGSDIPALDAVEAERSEQATIRGRAKSATGKR